MKVNLTALGSVSALMALAATASAQQIIYSSVTNQPITVDAGIDLDNDGTDDLTFGNSSFLDVGDAGAGDILIAADLSGTATIYAPGDTVAAADPNTGAADAENLPGAGISYLGFSFTYQEAPHTGWLEVDFPSTDPTTGTLIAAAWDSAPNLDITIPTSVPEPSVISLALLGGLAAFPLSRRVKPHDPNRR